MNTIDFVNTLMPYQEFFNKYLLKNKPCVLSELYTTDWPCRKDWVTNGQLDIDYMIKHFGHHVAPVVNCNQRHFSSHGKNDFKVKDFFDYWRDRDDRILYLKDWHLQRLSRDTFYEVLTFFSSDWLNEYWDMSKEMNDDYRFVYIGVKDSWTPFHADAFHSYSWSANVCGLKKWILYPPGKEDYLKDKFGNLPFDIREVANYQDAGIEVIQRPGEVIFVPSGWHHQVFNLEDAVSINHNWINGCSIIKMLNFLLQELVKVKHEIEDCKQMDGFHEQCQLILFASAGINLSGFYDMIITLLDRRLETLTNIFNDTQQVCSLLSKVWISSKPQHGMERNDLRLSEQQEYIEFDLLKLSDVLRLLLTSDDFLMVCSKDQLKEGWNKMEQVDRILVSNITSDERPQENERVSRK